jgi:hypothetical protein
MGRQEVGWKPSRRDELITLARYGKVTPQEAEAEARAKGFEPFERQPELPAFDPMRESRWTIVMAVAWIAWRDIRRVRENCAGFRSECSHWIFREWNEPDENGGAFVQRAGWFLESWHEATTVRLSLLETILKAREELPPTFQMPVREAEEVLWRALSDGHLTAEALNEDGRPVDIPAREWSYLKLFEDGKRDALRYGALDRRDPFTEVKLRRDDLIVLWPAVKTAPDQERAEWPITPSMLEPIAAVGTAGYVPLCAAIQWIMTSGGTRAAMIHDAACWYESVGKLWPAVCDGQVELIGLQAGQSMTRRIPGHCLTLIKVLPPLHYSIGDILLNAPSHITCQPYIDQEHWHQDFNDKLYELGRPDPSWTHLQVRKSDVLERWPKGSSIASVEHACYRWLFKTMQAAPTERPKSRDAFWTEAQGQFVGLAKRQFLRAWQRAVADSGATWSKSGRPKSNRSGN